MKFIYRVLLLTEVSELGVTCAVTVTACAEIAASTHSRAELLNPLGMAPAQPHSSGMAISAVL